MTLAAAAMAGAAFVSGCGASDKEVRSARSVAYDAEYALVYSEVLEAVRGLYPDFVHEDAASGAIRTPWFPVHLASDESEPTAMGRNRGPVAATGGPRKRFYIRFDIELSDERPWRVRVEGRASSWVLGQAMPVVLAGSDEPPWVEGRVDSLQVAIYRRLEGYAVSRGGAPAGAAEVAGDESVAPGRFGDLPAAAERVVGAVWRAARGRDFSTLEGQLHASFTWSLGAPPSARQALILWRADPALLDALAGVLEAGCGVRDDGVTCPLEDAGAHGYRARFESGPGGVWKMTAFVPIE